MNRTKIEILFIIILITSIGILSQTTTMYKTEYIGLDWNPWYKWMLILICIAFLLFNHIVIRMRIITNLIYSATTGILLSLTSFLVVRIIVGYLEKIDNQVTPLGWQFKYKWLELLLFGLLLVLATEIVGKRLKKGKPVPNNV